MPHDPFAAVRERNYRLFIGGWLPASIGMQMQGLALAWEIWERTGDPLALGDYFFDWKMLNATVVDENHETVLAQLRVVVMETEDDIVKGGVMSVPGKGLYVVGCEGP